MTDTETETWRQLYTVERAERQQLLTLLIECRLHLAFITAYARGKGGAAETLKPAQDFIDAGIYGRNNLTEKVQ